jgi:hypothetical protein
MLFCVSAQSPNEALIKANGRWTIEAVNDQRALDQLRTLAPLSLWPHGSDWYVSIWCQNCPHRVVDQDRQWHYEPIHCHGRRE